MPCALIPQCSDEWSNLRAAMVYPTVKTKLFCHRLGQSSESSTNLYRHLVQHGVELYEPNLPRERVDQAIFARDPLFVVGSSVFSGQPSYKRRGEEVYVREKLTELSIPFQELPIDGGNILLISKQKLLMGFHPAINGEDRDYEERSGERKDMNTIKQATGCHVTSFGSDDHIDLQIAPLPNGEVLIRSDILRIDETRGKIRQMFPDIREIQYQKGDDMRLNLFWLNTHTVLAPGKEGNEVHSILQKHGYDVWRVFGTAETGGGSARCAIAPLLRE